MIVSLNVMCKGKQMNNNISITLVSVDIVIRRKYIGIHVNRLSQPQKVM